MSALAILPHWKKNATAYERLSELALWAKTSPHKFKKFTLVFEEHLPSGNIKVNRTSYQEGGDGLALLEHIGLLEAAKQRVWEDSKQ